LAYDLAVFTLFRRSALGCTSSINLVARILPRLGPGIENLYPQMSNIGDIPGYKIVVKRGRS